MFDRRQLLTGIGALICAPAIVRASSLMPVKSFIGDGIALTSISHPFEMIDSFEVSPETCVMSGRDENGRRFMRGIARDQVWPVLGFMCHPQSRLKWIAPPGGSISAPHDPSTRIYLDYP